MSFLIDLLAATLRNATPLVYGTVGETYAERSGVLNLGIEGTMYAGAFAGFATAWATGSPLLGLVAAIVVGHRCRGGDGTDDRDLRCEPACLGHRPHDRPDRPQRVREPADLRRRRAPAHRADVDREPVRRPGRDRRDPRPVRADLGRVPGRGAGGMVAPAALELRPRDPGRRREPRGGRRGRGQRRPHALPGAHDRRRADGHRRRLHHARRCSAASRSTSSPAVAGCAWRSSSSAAGASVAASSAR